MVAQITLTKPDPTGMPYTLLTLLVFPEIMRIPIIGLIVSLLVAPAGAEEVLHCRDSDVRGFKWTNGKHVLGHYRPLSFTVKIIGPNWRIIMPPASDTATAYSCFEAQGAGLGCWQVPPNNAAANPFVFIGDHYRRVKNFSQGFSYNSDFYVAYGICKKLKSKNIKQPIK